MCGIAFYIKDVSIHVSTLCETTLEVCGSCFYHALSSLRRCGLAETVVPGFHVDSDSASSVLVLDLVCVCVSCCCLLVVLLFGACNNSTVVFRSTEAMVDPFSRDWFALDSCGRMDTMFTVCVAEKN